MNKKRQRQSVGGDNGFELWGGYMSAKKSKLQDQFNEQAGKESKEEHKIFSGVSIFVNGYTVPSADDLKRIMMVHGGIYHHYYSTDHTTHIIASNLPDVKIKQLKSLHVRVVKPEWVTACLDAGRQVDYRPFLLYSHQSRKQPSIVNYAETNKNDSGGSNGCALPKNCFASKVPQNIVQEPDLFDEEEHMQPAAVASDSSDRTIFVNDIDESATNTSVAPDLPKKQSNKAMCATEPNFLSDFYGNSRLHHISTMGAMFKQYVNELRLSSQWDFPGRVRLRQWKNLRPVQKSSSRKDSLDDEDEDFDVSIPQSSVSPSKVIMHIDMDCFFVSVGLRKHPHLKGKPVAVTHSKGSGAQMPQAKKGADRKFEFNYYKRKLEEKSFKSSKLDRENEDGYSVSADSRLDWMETIDDTDSMAEIASCSYEARSKGVKNGMFMGTALKLCPELKVIPYDFEGYKEVAHILYDTVASYTLDIEAVSCDEMFVDCSSILKEASCSPLEFATYLREEIKEKTNCSASTGFGANRLLSRLATRKAKPDGMFHLESTSVEEFMRTVKVNDLPGVGNAIASRLKAMGITTCGDLQKLPLTSLHEFGSKTGDALFQHCRGRDDRPLNFAHQRKSVSAEVNYGIRFNCSQDAENFFHQLALEVQTRLKEVHMKGRCVTLKLMVRAQNAPVETAKFMGHGVCDNITKSSSLPVAIYDSDSIFREVIAIFKKIDVNPRDLRGIGIQMSRLENISDVSSCGALKKFLTTLPKAPSSTLSTKSEQTLKCFQNPSATEVSKSAKIVHKLTPRSRDSKEQGIDEFMVSRKKSTRKDDISKLPSPSELDLAVFSALPEDIRNEILAEYSLQKVREADKSPTLVQEKGDTFTALAVSTSKERMNEESDVSLSQVDPTFLNALPADVRLELEADLHHKKKLNEKQNSSAILDRDEADWNFKPNDKSCRREKSILSDVLSPREVRDMIYRWVCTENHPLQCDIHMLKHYFQDLVVSKSIDNLYTIIQGFHRCVSKKLVPEWIHEYENIVSSVQAKMQEVYHSRLQVEEYVAVPSCSKSDVHQDIN